MQFNRSVVVGLGVMLTTGVAAQPFGAARPPADRINQSDPGRLPGQQATPRSRLALARKHSDRFVIGADSFFISSAASPEGGAAMLSRGNQGRLVASATMLSRLPPDLATKIAMTNLTSFQDPDRHDAMWYAPSYPTCPCWPRSGRDDQQRNRQGRT